MSYASTLLNRIKVIVTIIVCSTAYADKPRSWPEGFTEPYQTIQIATAESGVIERVLVAEGDTVEAGDVIAKLRCDVLKAARESTMVKLNASGNRDAAAVTLQHRQNHLKQLRTLHQNSHASDQEVFEAKFDVQLAKAKLQTVSDQMAVLRAELQEIDAQIDRRRVVSPVDGVVNHLPIHQGERVGAAERPVAELVCLDRLRVRFHLPTELAMSMRVGQSQELHYPSTDGRVDAVVEFIAPTTDSSSGTARVELLIDNSGNQHRSGVRCRLVANETPQPKSIASYLRAASGSSSLLGKR